MPKKPAHTPTKKKRRSPKKKKPMFILELPLKVGSRESHLLSVRFEAGRQLYNAVLGEALRRMDLMRDSCYWACARKMPAGETGSPEREERSWFFSWVATRQGFTDADMQSYATKCKNGCWIGDHLDAHTTQKIGTRAFKAVQRYQFRTAGRPRFKPKWKMLESMEGKNNTTGLRWCGDHVEWNKKPGPRQEAVLAASNSDSNTAGADDSIKEKWDPNRISLKPIFDLKDKHGVQTFALQCPVKLCRLVRRVLRGKTRWYVQLVIDGFPKWKDKNPVRVGKSSIDIGPSTIAAVSETDAFLEKFCANVPNLQKAIRRIQRAMDRSKRGSNPENYHQDGTIKKSASGKRLQWVFTHGYLRLRARLKELHRRLAAYRRTEHGKLANRVVAMGNTVMAEKLSYKAFQRMFGKSVRDRAPGEFMDHLRRKAANAGGEVIEFSTRTTKLSQTCHCEAVVKKPLGQRWHDCPCGVCAQRDLYSAFLGLHVHLCKEEHGEVWRLDTETARTGWLVGESLLKKAVSDVVQTANGGLLPASFGLSKRRVRDRVVPS